MMTEADVVRAFYTAVAARNGEALVDLVDHWFADDARAVFPESLPYGGTVAGARRLRRMVAALPDAPTGPRDVRLVSVVDGGSNIAAQLEFRWCGGDGHRPIDTGALELWTFAEGRVRELRAYYWDTDACLSST